MLNGENHVDPDYPDPFKVAKERGIFQELVLEEGTITTPDIVDRIIANRYVCTVAIFNVLPFMVSLAKSLLNATRRKQPKKSG